MLILLSCFYQDQFWDFSKSPCSNNNDPPITRNDVRENIWWRQLNKMMLQILAFSVIFQRLYLRFYGAVIFLVSPICDLKKWNRNLVISFAASIAFPLSKPNYCTFCLEFSGISRRPLVTHHFPLKLSLPTNPLG